MVFISSDTTGLWSHIVLLKADKQSLPNITLIPMIHIGEKSYLLECLDETFCHDIVLYEGSRIGAARTTNFFNKVLARFSGLSFQGQVMTKSTVSKRRNIFEPTGHNQVKQRLYKLEVPHLPPREILQIIADPDPELHSDYFLRVSLFEKIKVLFKFILGSFYLPFLSRRALIEEIFLASALENEAEHITKKFTQSEGRDRFLAEQLLHQIYRPENSDKSICVQFGHGHMPPLLKILEDEGYVADSCRKVLAAKATRKLNVTYAAAGYGHARDRIQRISTHTVTTAKFSQVL